MRPPVTCAPVLLPPIIIVRPAPAIATPPQSSFRFLAFSTSHWFVAYIGSLFRCATQERYVPSGALPVLVSSVLKTVRPSAAVVTPAMPTARPLQNSLPFRSEERRVGKECR